MGGCGLVFVLAPTPLLRLFTHDPEVIGLGTSFLMVAAILQIPMAVTLTLSGSLRGAGDTLSPFVSTVIGSWGVRVPLAWMCAVVWHADLRIVWCLMAIDWLVRMMLLVHRVRTGDWYRRVLVNKDAIPTEGSLAPVRAS
jgi:Na+-driven multidrug efflux pump